MTDPAGVTEPSVTILDVGHGLCVLLTSEAEVTLIDTGAGSTVLDQLRSLSRTTVRRVLISHADRDHVGALLTLLSDDSFEVQEIWLNSDAFKESALWAALIYEIDDVERAADTQVQFGVRERQGFSTGPFDVEILAPRLRLAGLGAGSRDTDGRRLETNSLSVVARVHAHGSPLALLPGDIDEVGLAHLLDQTPAPDLYAPILVFPHHGGHVSRASNASANADFASRFVSLVRPTTVIFSIGRGQHGTPRKEIIDAIRNTVPGINILCTQLSMLCSSAPVGAGNVAHLLQAASRGRHVRAWCAGTIIIDHHEGSWRVRPSRAFHQAFIAANASTALCTGQLSTTS